MKSSEHKNKQFLSVAELVEIVQNQNWKKDVSFVAIETFSEKSSKWREEYTKSVSEIPPSSLKMNLEEGWIEWTDGEYFVHLPKITGHTLINEVLDNDGDLRATAYIT